MTQYTQISLEERETIFLLLKEKKKPAEIARTLKRDSSTIGREIARNSTVLSRSFNGLQEKTSDHYYYLPDRAQTKTEKRRKEVNWRAPLKRPEILQHVIKHLKL